MIRGGLNVHVVPTDDGWTLALEGETAPLSINPTEEEAIDAGRAIARSEQSELVIHGHDGDVRERDSYRPEPEPHESA
jgi:hypothetical protein